MAEGEALASEEGPGGGVRILFVGDLVGGFFGGFVGTLLAIPVAGAIQVVVRELWQSTSPEAQLEIVGGNRPSATVP